MKMEECWIDFCILEEMLEDISMYDYPALGYAYKNEKIYTYSERLSLFQVMRLERCGALYRDEHGMSSEMNTTLIRMTPQGRLFCEVAGLVIIFICTSITFFIGNYHRTYINSYHIPILKPFI